MKKYLNSENHMEKTTKNQTRITGDQAKLRELKGKTNWSRLYNEMATEKNAAQANAKTKEKK
jgi:hypothetical protein